MGEKESVHSEEGSIYCDECEREDISEFGTFSCAQSPWEKLKW